MRALALVLLLAFASAPASAQCVVRSRGTIPRVRIDAPGAEPFEIAIMDGHDVELRPIDPERARVLARRPLRFEGTTDPREVAFLPLRDLRLAGGALALDDATELHAVTLTTRDAVLDLPLPGGAAIGVRIPCGALRLRPEAVGERGVAGTAPRVGPSGYVIPIAMGSLAVRARRGGPIALTLRVDAPDFMRMIELSRRDGAVEIVLAGPPGTHVRGWVDEAAIRAAPELVDAPLGEIGTVGHGCGRGMSHPFYRGRATLRRGAELRVSADGPAWARAVADVELPMVLLRRREGPVEIEAIAGLRGASEGCAAVLEIAWARVEDVRLAQR